jgi:hypothetical protein
MAWQYWPQLMMFVTASHMWEETGSSKRLHIAIGVVEKPRLGEIGAETSKIGRRWTAADIIADDNAAAVLFSHTWSSSSHGI